MANTDNSENVISEDCLIETIKRSGYLLESEISDILSASGFFVESNQVIQDTLSGKSREIDLTAEYNEGWLAGKEKVSAKINFVFELKNNPYPMVMMTRLTWTPNIVLYEALREVITETESVRHSFDEGFYERLMGSREEGVFTQYCTFKKKKEGGRDADLMAWHPEEFHEGLMKIVQYCDKQEEYWESHQPDAYLRDFLYLPVLVLGGELMELTIKDGSHYLSKVGTSKLLYNYHRQDEKKSALIFVVTKQAFNDFIKKLIETERSIEEEMKSKIRGA